jgi:hypothetical protein
MERTLAVGTGALSELNRSYAFNTYMLNHSVETGLIPAIHSLTKLQRDVGQAIVDGIAGRRGARATVRALTDRVRAGARYNKLVRRLGAQLFGTATFPGETQLAENDYLRLSYLPLAEGTEDAGACLFHAGGFLPYSDQIFRILPEANLFSSFLQRGVPVYALELKGDRTELGELRDVTLESYIEMLDEMSDVAFAHQANNNRKMIIEGYCGLGMPMLCYLAAKPEKADAKFAVATTMVAPVDARQCTMMSEPLGLTSTHLLGIHGALSQLLAGHIRGQDLRVGMDIPLGAVLYKSAFGRFVSGWGSPVYAHLSSTDELDPMQRREMAGAYWISPENAKRFPMPVDLVRCFVRLFREGVDEDLVVPATYKGKSITLKRILDETGIHLVGFYGGKDRVVPESTARVLQWGMGDRYTHVVHKRAGHISYVLSPEQWNPRHPHAFEPNPLELLLSKHRETTGQPS